MIRPSIRKPACLPGKICWLFGLLLATVLPLQSATYASSIEIAIHQDLVERVTREFLPHFETRRYQGELNLGLTRQPWATTATYTVRDVKYVFAKDAVNVNADVHIRTPDYEYDAIARGKVYPRVEGRYMILELKHLRLPVYFPMFGTRVDLGSLPATDFLPPELRAIKVDLNQFGMPIEIPNKPSINIRATAPKLFMLPPRIVIRSPLGY